jgi:ribosomal protein S18 acetylase RimI-like enzyme
VAAAIRLLEPSDLRAAGRHIARHASESGRDGDILFAPFSQFDRDAYEATRYASWRRVIEEPGWERCWGAFDGDTMVGHVDLTGGLLYSALHRARLGIGVERRHRRVGIGRALLDAALAWARAQTIIRWVDLSVFAHNEYARKLYLAYGFREVGMTADAYRIQGRSVDDVHMVLDVG